MPDCSGVWLEINQEGEQKAKTERFLVAFFKWAEERGYHLPDNLVYDTDDDGNVTLLNIADWDSAWGTSGFRDNYGYLLDFLRAWKIPHSLFDGGHYTWDSDEEGWAPGMGELYASRNCSQEGTPFLTRSEFDKLKEYYNYEASDIADGVDDHFGSDPRGWISWVTREET